MQLDEFYDYKNLVMKDLCSDPEIIKLLTGNENAKVPNHAIAYNQIFPYEFVPETVSEATTFICFDVDIASVENKTFYRPILYIWAFTHKSKLRHPEGGLLLDKLSVEINRLFNGSRYFGLGELELASVGRFIPTIDYYGRDLTFIARDFNRTAKNATYRNLPSNRKTGV